MTHHRLVLVLHESTAVFIDNVLSEEHGVCTTVLSACTEQKLAFARFGHRIGRHLNEIVSTEGDIVIILLEFLPGDGVFQRLVFLELQFGHGIERLVALLDDVIKCGSIIRCLIDINIVRVVEFLRKLAVAFHELRLLPCSLIILFSLKVNGTEAVAFVVWEDELGVSDGGVHIFLRHFRCISVHALIDSPHHDGSAVAIVLQHTVGSYLGISRLQFCNLIKIGMHTHSIVLTLLEIRLGVGH